MDEYNEESSDDERQIMKLSWKKLEKQHLTDGFREGALAGKDGQYQKSFDDGYANGFQNSYELAIKYGENKIKSFVENKQIDQSFATELQNLTRELCTICSRNKKN